MAEQVKPPRKTLGCGGAIGIAVLVLVALGMYGSSATKKEQSERSSVALTGAADVEAITVDEIADAFEANEVAATQRFGAGRRKVTGKVEQIITGFDGDPIVTFKTKGSYGAQASLEAGDASAVAVLREGDTATVLCDKMVATLARAAMTDCALVPTGTGAPG